MTGYWIKGYEIALNAGKKSYRLLPLNLGSVDELASCDLQFLTQKKLTHFFEDLCSRFRSTNLFLKITGVGTLHADAGIDGVLRSPKSPIAICIVCSRHCNSHY